MILAVRDSDHFSWLWSSLACPCLQSVALLIGGAMSRMRPFSRFEMQLTQAQFDATFGTPMRRLPQDAEPPFDFSDYLDSIPESDFCGRQFSGDVTYVYEHPSGAYQHVLLDSDDPNFFIVVVLDVEAKKVFGHRALDIGALYGLRDTTGNSSAAG